MIDVNQDAFYEIDSTNLTEEYGQQPARYVQLVRLYNQAERGYARAKAEEERAYAEADEYYRKEMTKKGEKFTETLIKSKVILDEVYSEASDKASEANSRMLLYKQLLRAMEMRSDMLISMGAHMRAEISMTSMRVKEKAYDDTVDEARRNLRQLRQSEE